MAESKETMLEDINGMPNAARLCADSLRFCCFAVLLTPRLAKIEVIFGLYCGNSRTLQKFSHTEDGSCGKARLVTRDE